MQGTCPALHRSRTVVLRRSGTRHVTPQLDKKTAKNLLFRQECGIIRRTVKDKATPKTGGVTNHAQPTAASSFELHISNFGLVSDFEIRVSDFPRSVGAYYTKRTQFTVPLASRRHFHPRLCKTDPIYEPPTTNYEQKMRNKPNFQPDVIPSVGLRSEAQRPKAETVYVKV